MGKGIENASCEAYRSCVFCVKYRNIQAPQAPSTAGAVPLPRWWRLGNASALRRGFSELSDGSPRASTPANARKAGASWKPQGLCFMFAKQTLHAPTARFIISVSLRARRAGASWKPQGFRFMFVKQTLHAPAARFILQASTLGGGGTACRDGRSSPDTSCELQRESVYFVQRICGESLQSDHDWVLDFFGHNFTAT